MASNYGCDINVFFTINRLDDTLVDVNYHLSNFEPLDNEEFEEVLLLFAYSNDEPLPSNPSYDEPSPIIEHPTIYNDVIINEEPTGDIEGSFTISREHLTGQMMGVSSGGDIIFNNTDSPTVTFPMELTYIAVSNYDAYLFIDNTFQKLTDDVEDYSSLENRISILENEILDLEEDLTT